MRLPSYIRRRGATFYFVRRVPQAALHKPEFKGQPIWRVSLKTTDRDEARRLGAAQLRWFNAVVAGTPPTEDKLAAPERRIIPDESAMHALAGDYFRREFERWKTRRLTAPKGSTAGDNVDDEYELLLMDDPQGQISASVDAALERYARQYQLDLPEGSPQRYLLRSLLMQVWDDLSPAVDDVLRRERFAPDPQSQLVRNAPTSIRITTAWPLRKLQEHFTSNGPATGASQQQKIIDVVRAWEGLGLGETSVPAITHRHVSQFISLLRKTPINASKRFPKSSLLEAVELNGQRPEPFPTLSDKTIFDGYIPALRKLLNFARDQDIIENDPVTRLPKRVDKSVSARHRIFQVHELSALFRQPCFIGCASQERPNTPGTFRRDDEYHWAPIIALFTGARASEIAQLTVQRCVLDAPIPHLEIAPLEDGRVKTANANRLIPIHSKLVSAGFADFVKRQRARGYNRLFPNWERSKNEAQMFSSARIVRNFNEVVVPACIKRSLLPTFHTLRSNFKTQLAIGKVPAQFQNALMGHAQSGEDPEYLATLDVITLATEIEREMFEGIDLSHLAERSKS